MDNTHRALCDILAGQDLASSVPWEELLETASAQGVAPLLAWTLHEMGWPDPIPSDVQTHLKAAWRASAVRSMLMSHHLLEVIETLSRPPAIPVVLLKGAALGPTLYPESSVRPMCDLDVLVARESLDHALERLRKRGYREDASGSPHRPNALIDHHVKLRGSSSLSVLLEVHWTLVGGLHGQSGLDMGWVWEQTHPFDLATLGTGTRVAEHTDESVLTLTPTSHLLFVAAHLILQHGATASRLLWYYDVHLLIERWGERIDWGELVRRSRQFGWSRVLLAALQGTRERFGTALPEGTLNELTVLSGGEQAWVVRPEAGAGGRGSSVLAQLALLDWPGRLNLLRGHLLPSPAFVRWRYHPNPPWLWPLCYPYRWADIACEAVATVWKALRARLKSQNQNDK